MFRVDFFFEESLALWVEKLFYGFGRISCAHIPQVDL